MDSHYTGAATYNPNRYAGNQKSALETAYRSDYKNCDNYTFGAGRRICPCTNIGERTLGRMTARMLWAFDMEHAVDANGNIIELDLDAYEVGFFAAPLPF
jgi:cytochrome P450